MLKQIEQESIKYLQNVGIWILIYRGTVHLPMTFARQIQKLIHIALLNRVMTPTNVMEHGGHNFAYDDNFKLNILLAWLEHFLSTLLIEIDQCNQVYCWKFSLFSL